MVRHVDEEIYRELLVEKDSLQESLCNCGVHEIAKVCGCFVDPLEPVVQLPTSCIDRVVLQHWNVELVVVAWAVKVVTLIQPVDLVEILVDVGDGL